MRAHAETSHQTQRVVPVIASAIAMLFAGDAVAQQRRDFMLEFQPEGSVLTIDHVGTGAMLGLEHRHGIYGASNELVLGTNLLAAYPLGELSVRSELRMLFLSLGGMLAYRTDWRNLSFEAGENKYCVRCNRAARRDDSPLFGDSTGTDSYPIAEAKATIYLPLNEYLVGSTTAAMRYEGRRERSYDWIYTSVYGPGVIGRWEALLFVKHRDWGGIGPYAQLLILPRDGPNKSQWAFGFNAVTRLGLLPRNDLLFLTFLMRPGDDEYGQHAYYSPVRALIVYRMILPL